MKRLTVTIVQLVEDNTEGSAFVSSLVSDFKSGKARKEMETDFEDINGIEIESINHTYEDV